MIPDEEDVIVEALHRLCPAHDYVFTSGGIGTTHDDITYASVAKALGRKLALHEPTQAKMLEHDMVLNAPRLRMATLPTPCEALETPGLWVPLCVRDAALGKPVPRGVWPAPVQ